MQPMPQTETVSSLKNNQAAVLAKIRKQPLLLLQNSKPVAVMVSLEEWNRTAARLRELERHNIIRQRVQEAQATSEPDISFEEFMADLEATDA
ncbi:MAG: type II toxin-antitoxin system Phd/YefM family antitoxin [Chloroflexota bacterium]|nr:type II toxin-antitoxin system Phd/YefM family antitoxin [Chloroflexota bacterium]